ncbi:MAG: hypothetical protein E7290_10225 [Lachnospiraceae bacterium]|nr:hypothetical protein [Lachnospiraceae bacterium]
MFDFFRDIALEVRGIDPRVAQLEKLQKKKDRDKDKYIFSYSVKRMIYFVAIAFLVIYIPMFPVVMTTSTLLYKIRLIAQVILAIGTMICISFKKRKKIGEKLAIAMIILFVILQYSTTVIMTI